MPEELAGRLGSTTCNMKPILLIVLIVSINNLMWFNYCEGEYKSLSGMTPRELNECFESEVFTWSGDTWARDTSLVWQPGTGM